MVNYRKVINVLGLLLLIEGAFIGLCIIVSLVYGGYDLAAFIITFLVIILVGGTAWISTRNEEQYIGKREGFIIVGLVWVMFSIFGCLPFIFSGAINSVTDAFFETMSGFTTTGATILDDIEAMPHGLLFWRSLTQWIGGLGIIVLSLAILPILGVGGMQLFIAEVPGPTKEKIHPRVKETAKRLWGIYIIFTVAQAFLMMLGGMSLFDAVNHSFTTMATGGFSTKQASIAHFDSAYIQYIIILFMLIAGTNFTLSYFAFHRKFRKVWENDEFRFYLTVIAIFTLIIGAGFIITSEASPESSLRTAAFQVVSIVTTTGYVTSDYLGWFPLFTVVIFLLMFFGGSAGSTAAGVKMIRVLLIFRNSHLELKRLIYPNAVLRVRYNDQVVSPRIISNVMAFVFFYIAILLFSVCVMGAMGYNFDTSFGAVAATLGNIGPGMGDVGPVESYSHIPVFGKWFLSFMMMLGRLELFTVLVLFSPSFWRK